MPPRIALLALAASLSAAPAAARPQLPSGAAIDWHPPPFTPRDLPRRADTAPTFVGQVGEVAVLEGDLVLLSDLGKGRYGIVNNIGASNSLEITRRFYEHFPDDFDEVIVFTSFHDYGSPGAFAYEQSVANEVRGIGMPLYDNARGWGSPQGRLRAFVNMKQIGQYELPDGLSLTHPGSLLYPVLAQEFSHRWLAFLLYRDANGKNSNAMLGRDEAHWACTLEADASVQDGNHWIDNGNGRFTIAESNARFSPLDLYAMGLAAPDEVPPWFLLGNAIELQSGQPLEPAQGYPVGTSVRATRENITISQVISANGPRVPAAGAASHDFRAAFVLVTKPGESATDAFDFAGELDRARVTWEQTFIRYTGGRGTVCTQLSAPCGEPTAAITEASIDEQLALTVTLHNGGPTPAIDIVLTATSSLVTFPPLHLPALPAGATTEVTLPGTLSDPGDTCGKPLLVELAAKLGPRTWKGFATRKLGSRDLYRARFDEGAAFWAVDPDQPGATPGRWEWGHPGYYGDGRGYTFQPDGGPGGGRAWFTGTDPGYTHSLPRGASTLWSPEIDLSSRLRPRLRYQAWFVALRDFGPGDSPDAAFGAHLVLEASNDRIGWIKIDQIGGESDRWRRRDVDLLPLFPRLDRTRPLLFRFRVNRAGMSDEIVEAGIDDFTITADPECTPPVASPDAGGWTPLPWSCALGGAKFPRAPSLALLALAALFVRRRTRRSP